MHEIILKYILFENSILTLDKRYFPSTGDIMSSSLCAACKIVHKRPWDEKCKSLIDNNSDRNQAETVTQNNDMATNVQETGKGSSPDPQLKMINKLLTTVLPSDLLVRKILEKQPATKIEAVSGVSK